MSKDGSRCVVIIDSDGRSRRSLARILEASGFDDVICISDTNDAIASLPHFDADLVLVHLPPNDGVGVIEGLRRSVELVPIVAVIDDASADARVRALEAGANDFIAKPFDRAEVVVRARHLLDDRSVQLKLREINRLLEGQVHQRTRELDHAERELLEKLALAAEYRDDATGLHIRRIGENAGRVAQQMNLNPSLVNQVLRTAALHDVGKIAVPDRILLKPGPLAQDELAIMRMHTIVGAEILSKSWFPLLDVAATIAMHHHERWDGQGYPEGLKGTEIPIVARIVSVVDSYDTLTQERPYKQAWPNDRALEEISACSGSQFDPEVVQAFFALQGYVPGTQSPTASGF